MNSRFFFAGVAGGVAVFAYRQLRYQPPITCSLASVPWPREVANHTLHSANKCIMPWRFYWTNQEVEDAANKMVADCFEQLRARASAQSLPSEFKSVEITTSTNGVKFGWVESDKAMFAKIQCYAGVYVSGEKK